jgi:hypothetical protein
MVLADRAFKEEISKRIDALMAMQEKVAAAQLPVVWLCPVCGETLGKMRAFKAHILRLWEVYSGNPAVAPVASGRSTGKRCLLRDSSSRHVAMVARHASSGPSFHDRSRGYARALYEFVKSLKSSDDEEDAILSFNGYVRRSASAGELDVGDIGMAPY